MSGLLGVGNYEAHVTGRGGTPTLGVLPWAALSYSRAADDTGDATVASPQGDARVPEWMIDVEPWEHELVIWREGEPDPVFAGPIRTSDYIPGQVTVTARDGSCWFERRRNYTDHTYENIDLAYIFESIAGEALAQDPTPDLQIVVAPCGVVGVRVIRASEAARTADLLRELSRSGVDWTVVGRRILIGGADLADGFGTLVLVDEGVTNPKLVKAGDSTVTRQTIRWHQASDQAPMLTTVDAASRRRIGLLESVDEEPDIADAASSGIAAQSRLDLLSGNPRLLTCALTPDAPTTINQLVPGRHVDFRLGFLPIRAQGMSRLRKVTVSATQDTETVTVDCAPLGVV